MAWYYAEGGERIGPLEDAAFQALVKDGTITPKTMVWQDGFADWVPHGEVTRPLGARRTQHQPKKLQLARDREKQEQEAAEAAQAADEEAQPKREKKRKERERARAQGRRFGGLWVRGIARIIDGFIVTLVMAAFSLGGGFATERLAPTVENPTVLMVLPFVFMGIGVLFAFCYIPYWHAKSGATPGKKAMGLQVVREDGEPIGAGIAWGRFLVEVLFATLLAGIGYLICIFDKEKRTLHDMVCKTRVVKV